MKNQKTTELILSLLFYLVFGSCSNFAQAQQKTPIIDTKAAATLSTSLFSLGVNISLNGGDYIYNMDSTLVASVGKGEFADFTRSVLDCIKFEYSNPECLGPIIITYSGSECYVYSFFNGICIQ
ncbi:MAG: hypothetical protein J5748_00875 [Bacteroidales bacterium]|nr:hypothetical protein [Bacteroidales bacterium]